ncbi:MAG: extracellular solute-binding protein [bacterium]|nr:extracellular solute-binding protein [bacterium]
MGAFGLCADRVQAGEETVTLRVCNWEEYIDLGDWDEEERIELENGVEIFGEDALYHEFEQWYYETYGKRVRVEYSCFGTNEDLYNQLTLGDTYDLVCPSDYMIMKLMAEGALEPYSESFFDREKEENYYTRYVSPYIAEVFEENEINGESWSRYAAGYMWGVTGVLYNPELMSEEEASTWAVFDNPKFYRQITLKDNVRDTYFSTLGYLRQEQLLDEAFRADANYQEKLGDLMNDVSPETIAAVEELLSRIMGNIYALETDSGKADMVTGKIAANYQWSGDAVYAMDQAEEDDVYLQFAVPRECTNLWFDGWVMLRSGIGEDAEKKQAAEAFVNFLSRPENAVRNMYYIGYTSAISGGGEDDTVFSYLEWCYGAEEGEPDTVAYPVGYFFSGDNEDGEYTVHTSREQVGRQLYTQYPSQEIISRAAVMWYFDGEQTRDINQMWINIRCLDVREIPLWCVLLTLCAVGVVVGAIVLHRKNRYYE